VQRCQPLCKEQTYGLKAGSEIAEGFGRQYPLACEAVKFSEHTQERTRAMLKALLVNCIGKNLPEAT
jgi:hypothetical protein